MQYIYSSCGLVKRSLTTGVALAFWGCLVAAAAGESTHSRPNIVWIQTDEQRPDSLGCYGSEWAKTPHLDALAERGALFLECHVQSPVCIPSRTSMLAGKYPQELNVMGNFQIEGGKISNQPGLLPDGFKFFPNLFADEGYSTANIGKWHTPRHKTWQDDQLFILFDDVTGFYALDEKYNEADYRVVKRPKGSSIIIGGVYPEQPDGANPSSHVTDMAIKWLRDYVEKNEGKPFLLRVSHLWPHTPVLVPEKWDGFYDPDEVLCNPNNKKVFEERSEYDRTLAKGHGGMELSEETWKQNAADYYALCAYVDSEVGRLLDALDELGLTDNTIVAYNSDHGRNMGEYGTCEKNTFDREVWRTPFILAGPGIPEGLKTDELCELLDFGPTLCGLADIPYPVEKHGRALFNSEAPDAVFGIIQTWKLWTRVAVRTEKYRYECTLAYHNQFADRQHRIEEGDFDPNLFDLENDPMEQHNLVNNPEMAPVIKELHARIEQWLKEYPVAGDKN